MGGCAGVQVHTVSAEESKVHEKPSSAHSAKMSKHWLDIQYHKGNPKKIKKPDELVNIPHPPECVDTNEFDKIFGSLIGLALGDALGAHVEFRPRQYLVDNPVTDLQAGGTWGLRKGQFTDDTSMALCLAISLITRHSFVPYDQLVRYKWWYRYGYMSSTGECFDIGSATRESICVFESRQKKFAKIYQMSENEMDFLEDKKLLKEFEINCSHDQAAGNGGLMRLAPVPLFFRHCPPQAVKYSGISAKITHGDPRVYDACRYYGALIVAALRGEKKQKLLHEEFYEKHHDWFGDKPLHEEVQEIAQGSFKTKNGYEGGIRGKGFVLSSLEAALWAFYTDEDSFEKGVLAAVNLGDDTDTTAAIYGQLAGAYYGYKKLPEKWVKQIYADQFLQCLSEWIVYEGQKWASAHSSSKSHQHQEGSNSANEEKKHSSKNIKHDEQIPEDPSSK
ncbi:unnamed protein product [Adineta ricciae]|uniref:ADP-ribosylglycohydrolase n=1 Tax=Adineta ricciae TaxID=249248 RepID=A0A815PGK2_ADIRI|nr:unnamed protein product [Adineta ricciae]CAF1611474.1 unnamed protein product [Adineta ricciae]